jgi:hypothetical protein
MQLYRYSVTIGDLAGNHINKWRKNRLFELFEKQAEFGSYMTTDYTALAVTSTLLNEGADKIDVTVLEPVHHASTVTMTYSEQGNGNSSSQSKYIEYNKYVFSLRRLPNVNLGNFRDYVKGTTQGEEVPEDTIRSLNIFFPKFPRKNEANINLGAGGLKASKIFPDSGIKTDLNHCFVVMFFVMLVCLHPPSIGTSLARVLLETDCL